MSSGAVTAGWTSGKADEHVEAEVFVAEVLEVLALDDLDASVSLREGVAFLRHPRSGDENALGGPLVGHNAGQFSNGVDADCSGVALGLHDSVAAHDRIWVGHNPIDAVVLRCLSDP